MTRVAFLQRTREEWLGVMYLSAMLKARGHECEVWAEPLERGGMVRRALESRPDVLAFSCLTGDFPWALERAREAKASADAPVVLLGGTHVTLNPEEAIAPESVDAVCRGEGELPMAELADALAAGAAYHSIPNLWVRRDGEVVRNEVRDLVRDLDRLPFADRTIYRKYRYFRELGARRMLLGRGCPYRCTYCHNQATQEVYRGKGPYVRWRSVDSVMAEIDELAEDPGLRVLHFVDDSFGVNPEWMTEFVRRLGDRPGPRPSIQGSLRADMVTDELAGLLAGYGADRLRLKFAVECGDERYRCQVLRKTVSDATLLRAAEILRARGIAFDTYNIVGFPGETLAQGFATLELNLRLRPRLAICFVLQPFPGTELANRALRDGQLDPETLRSLGGADHGGSYTSRSPLRQPDIRKLENLHKVFALVVRHPALLPLARIVVRFESLAPLLALVHRLHRAAIVRRRRRRDGF